MISEFGRETNYRKIFSILVLGSFFLVWLCSHRLTWAAEKGYPNKPIKIVVPFAPGGGSDLGVRLLTEYLSQELGVPLIVENRQGASGMVGTSAVLKAKPDGYTLLVGGDAPMIHGPLGSPNPPYDPFKDFLPIGSFGVTPITLAVSTSSPFKTIADFVNEAKKSPDKLIVTFTNIDVRLYMEEFRKLADIKVKTVPYQATAEAISALLGRHVDLNFTFFATIRPFVDRGQARFLILGCPIPGYSVPTFDEAGYPMGEALMRTAFLVSAKTPKPIYERLVVAIERASKTPEVRTKYMNIGLIPEYRTPTGYTDYMKKKWDSVEKLIKEMALRDMTETKK